MVAKLPPTHPLQVLLRGAEHRGIGHVAAQPCERADAIAIYTARYPDLPVRDDPLVVIILNDANSSETSHR